MGIHNVFGLLYLDLLTEFGESKATTAWVASISFGLTFVFSPLSSFLCKRFGCKAVTTLGGILVGIGLLLSSFVDSIFRMYVTYSFLFGLGSSMCYVSSVLVLSGYFSKNLVVANGIGLAGAGVGTISLAPALSLLLDNYYWRDALRILSATSLLLVISGLIYYLVPAPMDFSDPDDYQEETKRFDFSLFKNKAYIVWIAVVGLVLFGFYIPYVHLVRHGQDLGIQKQDSAVLVGYMAMSQTVGKIVFGRIADHPRVNRVYLYQMCLLVCSVLTTLLPLFTTYKALLSYCIVFGFHEGCFVVLIAVLTGDIAGRKMMATAYGVMYFFTGIPMMLGPPVAGWMYAITKNYEPAFYMAGAFTTVGVCLLFLIPFLLPPEVVEEWRMRTNGFRMRIQSSTSSEATRSWTLDSGSYYSDSERESLQDYGKKDLTVSLVENVLESTIAKTQSDDSGLGFILEKYFSMPKLVNQQDCCPGNFSDYSSSDVWVHLLDPNRETIV
ncbi:hypothetical protein ACROYT_G015994 [Oculina patagonica]